MSFVNFAYGSNMCSARLRARTASAVPLAIGRLPGHRLAWHKVGRDGSAKCDIVGTGAESDVVWGVLYRIAAAQKPLLDLAEGLGQGYEAKTVRVLSASGVVLALAYRATHVDAALRPFDWYHAFVLAGAREHGLPPHYLDGLAAVRTRPDPDTARAELNRSLLRGG